MCGIAGIIDLTSRDIDRDIIQNMTSALAHRGPDDEGTWFDEGVGFGHRRLSIIDLSPAGHQPMENVEGTMCITYKSGGKTACIVSMGCSPSPFGIARADDFSPPGIVSA
jgi:glutamate synthase domain-containing protein 1